MNPRESPNLYKEKGYNDKLVSSTISVMYQTISKKKLKRKDRNLKRVIIITSSAKELLIPFARISCILLGSYSARE